MSAQPRTPDPVVVRGRADPATLSQMTTRTIVTSHPDVACDVCERRLLRGEEPDIFIAAGRRRTVCELCAPRAAHEGWMRESDTAALALPPMRPRRGRSFIDRLRQVGRPAASPPEGRRARASSAERSPDYAFLAPAAAEETPPAPRADHGAGEHAGIEDWAVGAESGEAAGADLPPSYAESAVRTFNASEFPRRLAGVARSLGAPEVSVRSAEHLESVVRIVVAWELCWYRYEVDLSDGPAEARVLEQGSELSELPREDRLANAVAGESGALSLLA